MLHKTLLSLLTVATLAHTAAASTVYIYDSICTTFQDVNNEGGEFSDSGVFPASEWSNECGANWQPPDENAGSVEGDIGSDFFSTYDCGVKINHYKREGGYIESYKDGGDGRVVGTCVGSDDDCAYNAGLASCYRYLNYKCTTDLC